MSLKNLALAAVMLLVGVSVFIAPAASADNTVVVEGLRSESRQQARAGKSTVFSPRDANRVDTTEQLKKESSVTLPDNGRPSATGFFVPRIRGQDARYTEIWFEDMQLQDPYSSLPIAESIDLRAFGSMELHSGFSPASLASTSPNGALRYRMPASSSAGRTSSAGVFGGDVAGLGAWSLSQYATPFDENRTNKNDSYFARLYLRHHQASGAFKYYNDNGTPYNKSDDYLATRKNNQTVSSQALPWVVYKVDESKFTVLGWAHQRESGIPSAGSSSTNPAEGKSWETSNGQLGRLRWDLNLPNRGPLVPSAVFVSGSATRDVRQLHDEDRIYLINANSQKYSSIAYSGGGGSTWRHQNSELFLDAAYSATSIQNDSDDKRLLSGSRKSSSLYTGASLQLLTIADQFEIVAEPKASIKSTTDSLDELHDRFNRPIDTKLKKTHLTNGSSISLASISENINTWAQAGRNFRPASILERFGDGSSISQNLEIQPERINHYELGGKLRPSALKGAEFELTGFIDKAENRIVIIPASANSLSATNIGKSEVQGVEAGISQNWTNGSLRMGVTNLTSRDLTGSNGNGQGSSKSLPGISPLYGALNATQRLGPYKILATSRYRDKTWRDPANQIGVPAVTIHDLGLHTNWLIRQVKIEWGISVLNLANTRRVMIEAPNTSGSKGYTSYSELDGSPLPGRQFKSELTIDF